MNSNEIDELIEVENYLLAKSAEKIRTPIKMELDKLRQVAEERAVNSSKGLASVLGIANSSPLSHLRSDSTVPAPMSAVSFKPGMSVYRPAAASTTASPAPTAASINSEERCPPTPSLNEGKRSKLSTGADENLNSASNLNFRFTEALNANTIPFSPVRASAQGINLVERESCPKKLSSRQKQIDYGKNTAGYSLYTAQVPKNQRKRGDHPWTPNKFQICSKRSWDGQVRKWRRALHKFDPESKEVEENGQFDEFDESCEIKSNE